MTAQPKTPIAGPGPELRICDDSEEKLERIGIVEAFGVLGAGAIISEAALAKLLHRHPVSIKRAISRGELPRPAKMMGEYVWTAGAIVRHLEARLEEEAKEAKRIHALGQGA